MKSKYGLLLTIIMFVGCYPVFSATDIIGVYSRYPAGKPYFEITKQNEEYFVRLIIKDDKWSSKEKAKVSTPMDQINSFTRSEIEKINICLSMNGGMFCELKPNTDIEAMFSKGNASYIDKSEIVSKNDANKLPVYVFGIIFIVEEVFRLSENVQ